MSLIYVSSDNRTNTKLHLENTAKCTSLKCKGIKSQMLGLIRLNGDQIETQSECHLLLLFILISHSFTTVSEETLKQYLIHVNVNKACNLKSITIYVHLRQTGYLHEIFVKAPLFEVPQNNIIFFSVTNAFAFFVNYFCFIVVAYFESVNSHSCWS